MLVQVMVQGMIYIYICDGTAESIDDGTGDDISDGTAKSV